MRLVVVTALAATPLILLGLMFAGYFYTTLRLASRWIDSLYLFFLWNIVYLTALRGLERGGAASGLPARAGAAAKRGEGGAEGGEPVVEEPPLALDQINQQSLRLTTLVLFAIFASAFYAIWSDLVTVIAYGQYHAVALHQHRGGQQRVAGGDAGQHDGGDRRGDRRLRAHPQPARFTGGGGAVAAAAAAGASMPSPPCSLT